MKRIHKMIALLTAATLVAGCYEDKGNYDYQNIGEVIITFDKEEEKAASNLYVGDLLEIHPIITFADDAGSSEHLTYQWVMVDLNTGEMEKPADWHTRDLKWTASKLIESSYLWLIVTDTQRNIEYRNKLSCSVLSPFAEDGVLVLGEKDGKSQFSFIKATDFEYSDFEEYQGIYAQENGETLPDGPLFIHEHFCNDYSTNGQLFLFTRNGAVDIDGMDFKRDITAEEIFDGGSYPVDVEYMSDAMFMSKIDLIADQDGHVYSRMKATANLFHSGYFLNDKLSLDGESLAGCRFIMAPFNSFCACLVHDTAKKRLFLITDSGAGNGQWDDPGLANAGQPMALTYTATQLEELPEGFVRVDDLSSVNVLCIGYNRDYSGSSERAYTIIFERGGELFCQEFAIERTHYYASFALKNPKIQKIQGLPASNPSCIYVQPYRTNNSFIYFAFGNKLWIYDAQSNLSYPWVKPYRANIVDMDAENYRSRKLALALDDGSVIIQNAVTCHYEKNQTYLYDSKRELLPPPPGEDEEPGKWIDRDPIALGTIKDICFKRNTGNGWDVNTR
ncbi:PKD-like family lipoprotein [Alistipes sp.]|uniref:PKD-like family lipoprotein n=1 Tax=Alistipes sp. TaxID=1872444 RepID=UPI003AF0016B